MQTPAADDDVLQPLGAVSARHGLTPLADQLFELRVWLKDDLKQLEQGIAQVEARNGLPAARVRHAALHLLGLPGKRIRPLCVLLAARLGGHSLDATLRELAVACELVHAATLLHDDVIDDSSERRGAPASRVLYGNSASILAGDHLLVQALQRVLGTGQTGLLKSLLEVIGRMVAAEALQLERRGRFEPDRATYLEVIRGKTAALFAWGLRAGGCVAGLSEPALAALEGVGQHLGTAFQLVDDVLDLDGDPSITGKDALVDVRQGKLTWPVILAAERDSAVAHELSSLAQDGGDELSAAQASRLVTAIRATGALDATRDYALQEAQRACETLARLPSGRPRTALQLVVELAVHRIQ